MTGICAIYCNFAQSRPILSLTSTAIRGTTQVHVRRNSVSACTRDTTAIYSASKQRAISSFLNVKPIGASLLTVSVFN